MSNTPPVGLRLFLAICCTVLALLSSCTAEESVASLGAPDSSHPQGPSTSSSLSPLLDNSEDGESTGFIGQQFYHPAEKRAYSYVSEFKRLPIYNFGLGKRGGDSTPSYGLGLEKRGAPSGYRQFSFGLGKRPSNSRYAFGLGKRSEDSETDSEEEEDEDEDEEAENWYDDSDDSSIDDLLDEEKRGGRPYSFGLGKRGLQRTYSFGLGKRLPKYSFGLGKRAPRYSFGLGKRSLKYGFGLGKRLPSNRPYSFGLGKREVDPQEQAAVAAEAKQASKAPITTNNPSTTTRQRRSAPFSNGEQAEWADAETVRRDAREVDNQGRTGRRIFSFGLGKRLPLFNFGIGKRNSLH